MAPIGEVYEAIFPNCFFSRSFATIATHTSGATAGRAQVYFMRRVTPPTSSEQAGWRVKPYNI